MLIIQGFNSTIVKELLPLLPEKEIYEKFTSQKSFDFHDQLLRSDRYLFCAGKINNVKIEQQTRDQLIETFFVNFASVVGICNRILAKNANARICIIGSESGYEWSYDDTYAASKAALHRYVETKPLLYKDQQLVCIAPGIIEDSGMTYRRIDYDNLKEKRLNNPKSRFLKAKEVSKLIHFLLYVDEGYITNTVIRINGGNHIV